MRSDDDRAIVADAGDRAGADVEAHGDLAGGGGPAINVAVGLVEGNVLSVARHSAIGTAANGLVAGCGKSLESEPADAKKRQ